MKSNVLIYIACNFLILQLVSLQSEFVTNIIYGCCVLGILTLGIAHGSIDNVLSGTKSGKSNLQFILKYVLVVVLFATIWWLFPNLAFILFVLVSAYHFGQAQFVEYNLDHPALSKLLFLSWGAVVLSLLFFFNGAEILASQKSQLPFSASLEHFVIHSSSYLAVISIVYAVLLSWAVATSRIRLQPLFKEVYILFLIISSMYLFDAFIAFSLFFIWIHSMKVMLQEFDFCQEKLEIKSVSSFILLFLPLTIASLIGTGAILLLVGKVGGVQWLPYTLLILLSCVTIPHSFVMDRFYGFLEPKNHQTRQY